MKILYFLILFLLGALSKEGALQKDVENFNVHVDEIIQSNGLFAVKKLQDFAKNFAVTGNTYGAVVTAGLEVGISKLDADTAAAAVSAFNNTLAKLDFIQTTVSRLQDELRLEVFDFSYGTTISKPFFHLFSVIRHAFAASLPHQGFEILERGCLKHDPFLALESMFSSTKCSLFINNAFKNYEKAFKIVLNAESKMDLRDIEVTEMENYEELKEYFYLMAMHQHHADFDPIFRNLTRDFGEEEVDFRSFYNALLKVKMFSDYEISNECWTKIVYNGVKHSRVKLQKFVDIIKFDCARAMISIAVCGNVTHFHNPESLKTMFNTSVNFAINISKQMTNFVNDIIKLAYPIVMKTAVYRDIGINPLEVSMLNEFSTKITKSLNDRDLEKYQYRVFVTTLTKDNVESKYKCRINGDCFDIVINNVRIFVIRYLSGKTKAINESDEFWNKTSKDWDFLLKTTEPAYYLNALAKLFFVPDLISRWSVIIFHVYEFQAREGSANARVGFDFSENHGLTMYKNLTRFEQYFLWVFNHDYMIYFIY